MRPFGAWRDNYHAALIADVIARVNGNENPMEGYFFMDEEARTEYQKKKELEMFEEIEAMVKGHG